MDSGFYCDDFGRLRENVRRRRPQLWRLRDLAASPWQRLVSHFCPHSAVYGETKNVCHPPPTALPWFGTLWLLPFPKWHWSWKDADLLPLRKSRPNRTECLTLWQKRTSRKRSKNLGDSGTGFYVREGTTSRVMAVDRPYDKFFFIFTASVRNI
jgi:hypothetical protein